MQETQWQEEFHTASFMGEQILKTPIFRPTSDSQSGHCGCLDKDTRLKPTMVTQGIAKYSVEKYKFDRESIW